MMGGPNPAAAIGRSGWIADGVAYIDLTLFPGTEESIAGVRRFMAEHQDARAIIFDIRGHHGGGPAEMDVIFSYLFPRETLLVGMDTRMSADRMGVGPRAMGPPGGGPATIRPATGPEGVVRRFHYAVPGPDTPLRRAQIFLLTSHRSGSAAEHFALALKRTHRATLIGEATAGANHFGGIVNLGAYSAFLPVGRTFDPDTNLDWEGIGVAPDVAIPADQALDEALRRLGVTAGQRRSLDPAA
jgi:C-terminal processing protease CtpA/Prc